MEFWIYENTIHRKVRIHRTECSFCNNGRGIHGGGKTQSGNWFGPFADLERAVETAQQRRQPDTRECEICLVHKSSITPVKDNIIPNEFEDAWEWDGIEKLNCLLQLAWTPRGRVVLDQEGKLRFPKVSSVPGLYRFRTRHPDGRRTLYIGESDSLRRRFGNYRNPGPSQETSIRINKFLIQLLSENGEVSVGIADSVILDGINGPETADLSMKSIRRLFENLAISWEHATDIERLNR